nr:HAD family hydrolase [uncultured Pseudomonas sp.]
MDAHPITGVIFDAFGTLLNIGEPAHPYRRLLRLGIHQGRRSTPADLSELMIHPLSLSAAAERLGIKVSLIDLEMLNDLLAQEIATIRPFTDAVEAVQMLREAGVKRGICSNLAQPYGPPLISLFPEMDGYALSYALGAMKPDPVIYQTAAQQLRIEPGQYFSGSGGRLVMIGDSRKCDEEGPRRVGVAGFHLDRRGAGKLNNLVDFARLIIEQNSHSDWYPADE